MEVWTRTWDCESLLNRERRICKLGGELVMSTAEWIGIIIFLIILSLLFFAAFGGTNITEQSVDDYIKRLMGQTDEKK